MQFPSMSFSQDEDHNLWIKRFEIQESNGTFLKHSTNSFAHNNLFILISNLKCDEQASDEQASLNRSNV